MPTKQYTSPQAILRGTAGDALLLDTSRNRTQDADDRRIAHPPLSRFIPLCAHAEPPWPHFAMRMLSFWASLVLRLIQAARSLYQDGCKSQGGLNTQQPASIVSASGLTPSRSWPPKRRHGCAIRQRNRKIKVARSEPDESCNSCQAPTVPHKAGSSRSHTARVRSKRGVAPTRPPMRAQRGSSQQSQRPSRQGASGQTWRQWWRRNNRPPSTQLYLVEGVPKLAAQA